MARGRSALVAPTEDLNHLLEKVASGDQKAFRSLYDKSSPVLFAICVRLMRDRDMAQDMFQEAMTRIWRKAHLFDPVGNALAWMTVVTRNCALSRIAAAPPPTSSLDDEGVLASVEAKSSDDPVTGADARRCLRKLNDKYRRCVTLIYLNGLSYEELAAEMGAPPGKREVLGAPRRAGTPDDDVGAAQSRWQGSDRAASQPRRLQGALPGAAGLRGGPRRTACRF
jgi:RNA polymerase sigma-70 factor (ECF subfamily)